MKICALIPCYNEGPHIKAVINECRKYIGDVLVYDDGSTDESPAEARSTGVEVVVHPQNKGKGQTLADGLDLLAERGYDAVITLDADGQHLPAEIPLFIKAAEDGTDIAIGNRMTERKTMPLVNWYTNVVTSLFVSALAHQRIHDSQVGYRVIRCDAWVKIRDKIISRNFEFEGEMLVAAGRSGLKIVDVPIATIYGEEVSKISPAADTWRFVKMVWRLLWTR